MKKLFVFSLLLAVSIFHAVSLQMTAAEPAKINAPNNLLQEAEPVLKVSVGSEIPDIAFHDIRGKAHHLHQLLEKGPVVFTFISTECFVAKRYTLRLNRLHEKYAEKGVSLFCIHSNSDETEKIVADHAKKMGYAFPVVKDIHGFIARQLAATMTPQSILIGQNRIIHYRGAIDDNRYETRVKHNYLEDALTAVLADLPVKVAQTKALGCMIHLQQAKDVEKVTYNEHIATILQHNCQTCHRPGQVGPFSLTSYEKAKTWAQEIKAYTGSRLMPPWKPEHGFGTFKINQRLDDNDLALINRWVEQDMPAGDPKYLPPPAKFNDEWVLGEPDLIVEMPEEYVVGPEGEDDYRHFVIPTSLGGDKYVEAIDVQPGNRKTVHHVIVYADKSGKARELDAEDPGPGYTRFGGTGFDPIGILGGWAPGTKPDVLPKKTGYWLPEGTDIVLQVHYYRTGAEERDLTRVGLYFSKEPKPKKVRFGVVINSKFKIPAGEPRYKVVAERTLERPLHAVSIYPHMHLLGKEIKVTAELPGGEIMPMIWIKNWDFNWQTSYPFKKPVYLPAGTKMKVVSYFDNSAENPYNPNNPPKEVGWGEKTTDEMCLAFFTFLTASSQKPVKAAE